MCDASARLEKEIGVLDLEDSVPRMVLRSSLLVLRRRVWVSGGVGTCEGLWELADATLNLRLGNRHWLMMLVALRPVVQVNINAVLNGLVASRDSSSWRFIGSPNDPHQTATPLMKAGFYTILRCLQQVFRFPLVFVLYCEVGWKKVGRGIRFRAIGSRY